MTPIHGINRLHAPQPDETVRPNVVIVLPQTSIDKTLQTLRPDTILIEIFELEPQFRTLYLHGTHILVTIVIVATQPFQLSRGRIPIVPAEEQRALRTEYLDLDPFRHGRVRVGIPRKQTRTRQAKRRSILTYYRGSVGNVGSRFFARRHGTVHPRWSQLLLLLAIFVAVAARNVINPRQQMRGLTPRESIPQHLSRIVRFVPSGIGGIIEDPRQWRGEEGGYVSYGTDFSRLY
mmetsp:Transcript_24043/g.43551  ORF Transcript_24043/g.43551 Transcript_24043/m.43551 type:complete len:234 (+) Transcript_24043:127-828(+)